MSKAGIDGDAARLVVTSSGFAPGERIPTRYTCEGENLSPPLEITGVPAQARALAVVVDDPDAPSGTFTHWVAYDLPGDTRALAEGALPDGAREGKTSFGRTGYGGPCPPAGAPHHYHFHVYALDAPLNLPAGATPTSVLAAIAGHVLAEGELVGLYQRSA